MKIQIVGSQKNGSNGLKKILGKKRETQGSRTLRALEGPGRVPVRVHLSLVLCLDLPLLMMKAPMSAKGSIVRMSGTVGMSTKRNVTDAGRPWA